MSVIVKYWPVALFVLNFLMAWACWSLRQLAVSEVKKIVDAAVAKLTARDDQLASVDALNAAELGGHAERLVKAEGRIETLTEDVRDLPTKADLEHLSGDVKTVREEVASTRREVVQVGAGVDRLEGYFLKRGVDAVGA